MIENKWDFFNVMDDWREEERFSSRPADKNSKHFIKIQKVASAKAVPWLMEHLSSRPSWQCMFALGFFTHVKVKGAHQGRFYHQVVDWIDWWEQIGEKQYNMTGKTWGDT